MVGNGDQRLTSDAVSTTATAEAGAARWSDDVATTAGWRCLDTHRNPCRNKP
jgi:hypothetical protein